MHICNVVSYISHKLVVRMKLEHGSHSFDRFLTSVELTPEPRPSRLKGHSRYSFKGKDHPHQVKASSLHLHMVN